MAAYTGPELCALEAHEVVSLLKKGEVSPVELVEASLSRIEAVEPSINAMPTVCADRAARAASSVDHAQGEVAGWLAGLPIGIKDLTPVKGVRTTFGTRAMADFVPDASDPLVERLEQRGAIVMGKTNTPEFGAGGNTFNEVLGATFNPWNTTLNAGGSSGGAAASLAAGEVWLSHGSDHGGSLRTPAAYCGVVGLRPSPGVAGGGGKETGFMREGAQGPMARSVTDCALFLDAMAGFEARFPISFPAPDAPYQKAVQRADGKVRIAFSSDLGGHAAVDDEVDTHLRGILKLLEGQGATVEETCPDLTGLAEAYYALRGLMWVASFRNAPDELIRHFKPTLAENLAFGRALTVDQIAAAENIRTAIFNNMLVLFETFDVLACPTVGCMPHSQSEEWVREVGGKSYDHYMDWLRYAFLATTTGLPAISVPVGIGPRGLPVGMQLIGKPRGEADLLAAARAVEIAAGGPLGPIDPVTDKGA